jgi:hypothetical protein
MAKIFGKRAVTAFQILVREGGDALEILEAKITNTSKATTMAAIQIDTMKGSFKLLFSAMQESAIQIGEILAPAIRMIAEIVRDAVKVFNALPKVFKVIIVTVPVVAAVLGLLIGPIALLLSMIPKMIIGISSLNILMHGALGPIGLVTLAIVAITAAIGGWISAERRQKEATRENVKLIGESISKRIDEVRAVQDAIYEYEKLASKTSRTVTEQKRLDTVIDKLNSRYPELNLQSDEYAENLIKIGKASGIASEELEKLLKMKRTLEKIEVTIEITELKQQIREIQEDLRDGANTFDKIMAAGFVRIDDSKVLNTLNLFKEIGGEVGVVDKATGAWAVNMADIKDHVSEIVAEEGGAARLADDLEKITDSIAEKESEILKTKTDSEEAGKKLTLGEDIRLTKLKNQSNTFSKFSGIYTEVLKKSRELGEIEVKLTEAQAKRKMLAESELEPKKKKKKILELEKPEPTDEEIALEEEKQKLIYDLHKQTLEAKLSESKSHAEKSLADALKYIEMEHEYKMFQMEREKELALAKAEEVGLTKLDVEESFVDKSSELERQRLQKIDDVTKEYDKKTLGREENKLSHEADVNSYLTEEYRTFLASKLEATEAWSDEYIAILNRIRYLEDKSYKDRESASRRWAYSMTQMSIKVGTAYGTQMTGKMTEAWKGGLSAVVDMVAEHYINVLRIAAAADMGMGNFAAAAYKAIQMSFIATIKAYAKSRIESAAVGAEVKKSGVIDVHAGEQVIPAQVVRKSKKIYQNTMNIASAEIGAAINKSGLLDVHAGEVIVDPGLVKNVVVNKTEKTNYQKNVSEISETEIGVDKLDIPPINIYYPMVDDQGFWENVFDEYVLTAWDKSKKRYGQ